MRYFTSFLLLAAMIVGGCTRDGAPPGGTAAKMEEMPPPSNRIDIPEAVRQNLGITFVNVERRMVEQTRRYPGRFELDPAASAAHGVVLAGRVTKVASVGQSVKQGDVVASIDSPETVALAQRLADAAAEVALARAAIVELEAAVSEAEEDAAIAARRGATIPQEEAAAQEMVKASEQTVAYWQAREAELQALLTRGGAVATELTEAGGKLVDAKTALAQARAEITSLHSRRADLALDAEHAAHGIETTRAALLAQQQRISATEARHAAALAVVHSLLGDDAVAEGKALRRELVVKADIDGVVTQAVAHGHWSQPGETLVTIVNPRALRLRIRIPVTDLSALRGVATARILAMTGTGQAETNASITGALMLLQAETSEPGMVDALVTPETAPEWALAGMTARAELVMLGGERPRLAVPLRATIRDGLEVLVFIRDPANPDKVIRQPVTLGTDDGEWVVIETGVGPEDEVVKDGIYELKLTGAGKSEMGGHFHADGTFHAEAH